MPNARPRSYRVFDPNLYHEVTQRIHRGKFLLDPNCADLKAAIYGQLAESMRRYDVSLLALHFMTDHFHALYAITCPYKFAKFLAHFHAGITGAYNRVRANARGPDAAPYEPVRLWHEMKWLPVATDERSVFWRLQYIMGQAVAANLVDHPAQFPGASTIDAMMTGQPLIGKSYDATTRYRDSRLLAGAQDHDAYTQAQEVHVTPPSCWAALTAEELRRKYVDVVDSVARVAYADLLHGKAVVTVAPTGKHDAPMDAPLDGEAATQRAQPQRAANGPLGGPGLCQDHGNTDDFLDGPVAKHIIPARLDESGQPFEAGAPKAKKNYATADGKRKKRPLILASSQSVRDAYEEAYGRMVEAYTLAKNRCRERMAVTPSGLRAPELTIPLYMLLGAMPYPS